MFPIPATSRWSGAPRRAGRSPAAAQPRDRSRHVELVREHVRPEPRAPAARRARAPGRSRALPRGSSPRSTSHGEPTRAAPARLDPPAARHAQVAAHDDPALEAQQQVLARPPRRTRARGRRSAGATPVACARGCGDSASSRCPTSACSRARGAMERIALGHTRNLARPATVSRPMEDAGTLTVGAGLDDPTRLEALELNPARRPLRPRRLRSGDRARHVALRSPDRAPHARPADQPDIHQRRRPRRRLVLARSGRRRRVVLPTRRALGGAGRAGGRQRRSAPRRRARAAGRGADGLPRHPAGHLLGLRGRLLLRDRSGAAPWSEPTYGCSRISAGR